MIFSLKQFSFTSWRKGRKAMVKNSISWTPRLQSCSSCPWWCTDIMLYVLILRWVFPLLAWCSLCYHSNLTFTSTGRSHQSVFLRMVKPEITEVYKNLLSSLHVWPSPGRSGWRIAREDSSVQRSLWSSSLPALLVKLVCAGEGQFWNTSERSCSVSFVIFPVAGESSQDIDYWSTLSP